MIAAVAIAGIRIFPIIEARIPSGSILEKNRERPSWQQPRTQVTLSELIPGQYVSTIGRIAYAKTSKRTDVRLEYLPNWFSQECYRTPFKAPFVSHRISYPLILATSLRSVYVHEFDDKSILLVVMEYTKIESKNATESFVRVSCPSSNLVALYADFCNEKHHHCTMFNGISVVLYLTTTHLIYNGNINNI